jgi:hypothetical protein
VLWECHGGVGPLVSWVYKMGVCQKRDLAAQNLGNLLAGMVLCFARILHEWSAKFTYYE